VQQVASVLAPYICNAQVSALGVVPVSLVVGFDAIVLNTSVYTVKNGNPQVFGLLPYGAGYPFRHGTNLVAEEIEQGTVYQLEVIPIQVLAAVTNEIFLEKAKSFEFEFIGGFKPGDVIVIDSKRMMVTLNGENALHLVSKDEFPEIMPEENEFLYSDISGTRVIRIRVKWQDRWL